MAERELIETLRGAAFIFETEPHGRLAGSKLACQAVARFLFVRDHPPVLAAPFLHMMKAFAHVESGGAPILFSKTSVSARERSRSPERKQIQRLAAMCLDVLMTPGKVDRAQKASQVARSVNKWPGMQEQAVSGPTVVNWRKKLSRNSDAEYKAMVAAALATPDPSSTIRSLLRDGPPGWFLSG